MRNYVAWVCVVIVAMAGSLFGQQPQTGSGPPQPAKTSADAELANLLDAKVKAEWEAIKNKDQKALGELLAEEYIGIEADGEGERYKWKALSELQASMVADYTLSFFKMTPLCANGAFVRYEVFIKFPPKSLVKFEKVMVGELWVKRDGTWKSIHYQETKVK